MVEELGSTVPRRQLGWALRGLRAEAGMTSEAVAVALRYGWNRVLRIESGLGAARPVDVRAMCELYGARPELTAALIALAKEAKARGWWHAYGGRVPDWLDLYATLESAACRLREHAAGLVPALLQTPAYASAAGPQRVTPTADEEEQVIVARLRRQALLRRRSPAPPRLEAVLSEAALLRVMGDAAMMVEQLRQVVEVGELPHVSVRVVPLDAGVHVGCLAGSFVLLDFPVGMIAGADPPVVYRESLTGALYLDRPGELAEHEQVWAALDALALDEAESRQLIVKVMEEIHHG